MVTLQHISKWALLVLLHWKAGLVGGGAMGVVTAALLLIEHWWGQFPKRYFLYVFVFGFLFVSGFLTWDDQYNEAVVWAARNSSLDADDAGLRAENTVLKNTPPKAITRNLPAPEPENKCWTENVVLPPPQTVPAARSSLETFIYCNFERKAPLFLDVDYDKEALSYGPILFPDGRFQIIDMQTHEKSVHYTIQSPSILPFQPFLVTVYGKDENPPRATLTHIATIDPER